MPNGISSEVRVDVGSAVFAGLLYYYATSLVVVMGVALGIGYIPEQSNGADKIDYAGAVYANWDGQWYADIARQGYFYKEDEQSSVAFFPAFPIAGRLLSQATGLREELALVVVANVLLAVSFAMFSVYLQERFPDAPHEFQGYSLVAMGILPTTFFFRMAYSESTFLMCQIVALYAMARRWPLVAIAVLIGIGTAARPVGVALIPAFLLHIRDRSETVGQFVLKSSLLVPLACWGLAAYMAYLAVMFGDPLAFVWTQIHWSSRTPPSLLQKLTDLVTLEPIRTLYSPSDPAYWRKHSEPLDLPFNLRAADPFFFFGALGLIVLGAARKWLSKLEWVTGACLLLIPYVTQGYEQHLRSMGRFAAATIVIYPVLGRLGTRLPAPFVAVIAAASGVLLGAATALFVRWYPIL